MEKPPRSRASRVLLDWVLPIGVGFLIAAVAVLGIKVFRVVTSSASERIVARFHVEDPEHNDGLAVELRALGPAARKDLFMAFLEIPGEYPHWKRWVGEVLVSEPFFGTRQLVDAIRGQGDAEGVADEWDARVAAAVLVSTLRREADTSLVVPPLVRWLEDDSVAEHQIPMVSIGLLRQLQVLPPDQEPGIRAALVALMSKERLEGVDRETDEERHEEIQVDRSMAAFQLGSYLDPTVRKLLFEVALDEQDEVHVRTSALRSLADGNVLEDPEPWFAVAGSDEPAVRQTVSDNLMRTADPAYDPLFDRLHGDPDALVRSSSVEAQSVRRRPTFLDEFAVLAEDHEPLVRFHTLLAAAAFKDVAEGASLRNGILVRALAESEEPMDVEAAVLALHQVTGQHYGFAAAELDPSIDAVDPAALQAFMKDAEGRAQAARQWREHFKGTAVYTDEDRAAALRELANHADPANVERAEAELAKLSGE